MCTLEWSYFQTRWPPESSFCLDKIERLETRFSCCDQRGTLTRSSHCCLGGPDLDTPFMGSPFYFTFRSRTVESLYCEKTEMEKKTILLDPDADLLLLNLPLPYPLFPSATGSRRCPLLYKSCLPKAKGSVVLKAQRMVQVGLGGGHVGCRLRWGNSSSAQAKRVWGMGGVLGQWVSGQG